MIREHVAIEELERHAREVEERMIAMMQGEGRELFLEEEAARRRHDAGALVRVAPRRAAFAARHTALQNERAAVRLAIARARGGKVEVS